MTRASQQARMLQSANDLARGTIWPLLTPREAQEAKDAAWTLYVTLYRSEQGDPAIHRANYMSTIAMIEKAAGFGE